MPFQKGNPDGHLKLARKMLKSEYKISVGADGQVIQFLRILRQSVSIAPHLGKQDNISPHLLGLDAGGFPFFQLFLRAASG